MSGMTDESVAALADLADGRHPGWRYLDYEYGIAKGSVAAFPVAVSEAIADTLGGGGIRQSQWPNRCRSDLPADRGPVRRWFRGGATDANWPAWSKDRGRTSRPDSLPRWRRVMRPN